MLRWQCCAVKNIALYFAVLFQVDQMTSLLTELMNQHSCILAKLELANNAIFAETLQD